MYSRACTIHILLKSDTPHPDLHDQQGLYALSEYMYTGNSQLSLSILVNYRNIFKTTKKFVLKFFSIYL